MKLIQKDFDLAKMDQNTHIICSSKQAEKLEDQTKCDNFLRATDYFDQLYNVIDLRLVT